MLIFGAIILGFESIPPWLALVLNAVPVGVFLLMCLYASSQRQVCNLGLVYGLWYLTPLSTILQLYKSSVFMVEETGGTGESF